MNDVVLFVQMEEDLDVLVMLLLQLEDLLVSLLDFLVQTLVLYLQLLEVDQVKAFAYLFLHPQLVSHLLELQFRLQKVDSFLLEVFL